MAEITTRNHKENKAVGMQSVHNIRPSFLLNFPQKPENLQLSVPHRLLTAALRRNILQSIETVGDLHNGNLMSIPVKEQHLDDPVFVQGRAADTDVDVHAAIIAQKLTNYIRKRGQQAGFPDAITIYSFRTAASEIGFQHGNDTARQILDHTPNSTTLERYYLKFAYKVALVSTAVGKDEDGEQAVLQERRERQVYQHATREQLVHTQAPAVTDLLNKTLATDTKYQSLRVADPDKGEVYRKRVRYRLANEAYTDDKTGRKHSDHRGPCGKDKANPEPGKCICRAPRGVHSFASLSCRASVGIRFIVRGRPARFLGQ